MMQGDIGFEDNQIHPSPEKGSTFWFSVRFEINQKPQLIESLPEIQVVSFISHTKTAQILNQYLENYHIQHQQSSSLLDLFSRLSVLPNDENTWVIIDHGGDTHTLLKEIRLRYLGQLAIYGYQMSLEPDTLNQYQATPLYQPLSRDALIKLLTNQSHHHDEQQQTFDGQGLHILAVDDHLPNLIVLEALLGELNVKTTKALSGQDAINLIKQYWDQKQPFDLVFMDIQMPVMSGIDTTRAIRSLESTIEHTKELPIIALTAHALSDEKDKLLTVGMNDYVTKPIQIEQLIHILTTWTHSQFDQHHTGNTTINHNDHTDITILDWAQSIKLAANKEELAIDLLKMLIESFDTEIEEMKLLIELEDFPQLEHVLHRLYGATRYVGTTQLQQVTGDFEQFISTLRKQQRKADEQFTQETLQRFTNLQQIIEKTRIAAKNRIYLS